VQLHVRTRIGQSGIVERSAPARSRRVAQAPQSFLLLGGDWIRLRAVAARREPRERALEIVAHLSNTLRLLRREILLFCRIRGEIVQLRFGAGDQLEVS